MTVDSQSPETAYASKGNIQIPKLALQPGETTAAAQARLKAKGEARHLDDGSTKTLTMPKVES